MRFPETIPAGEFRQFNFKLRHTNFFNSQFFPQTILTHIDSLIYVDTDTLFLSSIDLLWRNFNKFNASHMAALAFEHEDSNVSWYSRFAKHPYYGKLGAYKTILVI